MTNNNNSDEIINYKGVDWATGIEVRMKDETVWLTINQL